MFGGMENFRKDFGYFVFICSVFSGISCWVGLVSF